MTSVAAPTLTLSAYFPRDPAQVAQEKYSKQTWNERYAYITMIAFTALAVIANIFLSPTVLPMTLLMFDMAVLSTASSLVLPFVMDLFAEAKKCKTQGDKETAIAAKLQELHGMRRDALEEEFRSRDILPIGGLSTETEQDPNLPLLVWWTDPNLPLLARVIWREKQAEDFAGAIRQLSSEGKFRESIEASLSASKAIAKASFFAALIKDHSIRGKFKDLFTWVEMPLEERAIRSICEDRDSANIAQTRGPSPKFLTVAHLDTLSKGIKKIQKLLAPAEVTL